MIKHFDINNETMLISINGSSEPVIVNIDKFIELLDNHWKKTIKDYLYWEFYVNHVEGTIEFRCIVTKWWVFTRCEKKLKYKLIAPNEIIVYKDINSNIIQEKGI